MYSEIFSQIALKQIAQEKNNLTSNHKTITITQIISAIKRT